MANRRPQGTLIKITKCRKPVLLRRRLLKMRVAMRVTMLLRALHRALLLPLRSRKHNLSQRRLRPNRRRRRKRLRLKKLSDGEVKDFLLTGTTPDGDVAAEAMGEVVTNTTSQLTPEDLAALIAYLRSLPPLPEEPK